MNEVFIIPENFKIVVGGQTGADQAGLDWAIAHELCCGGWCPKVRRSEDGPIDARYNLQETPNSIYLERTEWNVRDSDATVIFTLEEKLDGGSKKLPKLQIACVSLVCICDLECIPISWCAFWLAIKWLS